MALRILTEAAINRGLLSDEAVDRYRGYFPARDQNPPPGEADSVPVEEVLYLLEHDGYLARHGAGYRFVSGLLEDWWRSRHAGWWRARPGQRPVSID